MKHLGNPGDHPGFRFMPVSPYGKTVDRDIGFFHAEGVQFLKAVVGIKVRVKFPDSFLPLAAGIRRADTESGIGYRDKNAVHGRACAFPGDAGHVRRELRPDLHDMDAQRRIGADDPHIGTAGFVRGVLRSLIAVAQDFHHVLNGNFLIRSKAERVNV